MLRLCLPEGERGAGELWPRFLLLLLFGVRFLGVRGRRSGVLRFGLSVLVFTRRLFPES